MPYPNTCAVALPALPTIHGTLRLHSSSIYYVYMRKYVSIYFHCICIAYILV